MSTPQRIAQRNSEYMRLYDTAREDRRALIDNPEHLRTNAESLLTALRKTNRRKCRSAIVAACVLFAAFAWAACAWLTKHFLP